MKFGLQRVFFTFLVVLFMAACKNDKAPAKPQDVHIEVNTYGKGSQAFDMDFDGIDDARISIYSYYGSSGSGLSVSGLNGAEVAYFIDSVKNWTTGYPPNPNDTNYYFVHQDMTSSFLSGEMIQMNNLEFKSVTYLRYSIGPETFGYSGGYGLSAFPPSNPFYVVIKLGEKYSWMKMSAGNGSPCIIHDFSNPKTTESLNIP